MEAIWDFIANILVALGILFTTLSAIFVLVSGLVSVYFGRRLFWVFVATLGFMAGLLFSDNVLVYLPPALEPFKEFFRLGFAVLVAFIALGLQRFGVVLAGGIAVGILAYYLAGELDVNVLVRWGAAGIAGLIAAALLWFSHDWMLIIITALTGSMIGVVGANLINPLPEGSALWVYLILVFTGILYQWRDLSRTRTEAILVAAPNESKPGVRSRLPFRRKDAQAVSSTPVTLIEAAPPAPNAVSTPPGSVKGTTTLAAAASAPKATATATKPPAQQAAQTAAVVAAASVSQPMPIQPVPMQTVPTQAMPSQPAPAQPAATSPTLMQPAVQAFAQAPAKSQATTQPAVLPTAPAPTANVDGETVVLKSEGGKWLRLPRWQRSAQSGKDQQAAQQAEVAPAQPKPFFKSAPEAYG